MISSDMHSSSNILQKNLSHLEQMSVEKQDPKFNWIQNTNSISSILTADRPSMTIR